MITKRKAVALLLPLLMFTMLSGCKTAAYQVHPGSPNVFDSQTYDVLVAADAAIQQTKSELANGAFTGNLSRNVSLALNGVIQAYNIANTAYQGYHAAATATPPTATPAMAANVQAKTSALNDSITNLNAAKGGK